MSEAIGASAHRDRASRRGRSRPTKNSWLPGTPAGSLLQPTKRH